MIVIGGCSSSPPVPKAAKAEQQIQTLYLILQYLGGTNVLTKGTAQGDLASIVYELISSRLPEIRKQMSAQGMLEFESMMKAGKLVDCWGNPINISWTASLDGGKPDPALLKEGQGCAMPDVAIWSSGPNGANEYGGNDDVFMGKVCSSSR